jgi:hypothetical protein
MFWCGFEEDGPTRQNHTDLSYVPKPPTADHARAKGDINMKFRYLWVILIVLIPLSVFGQETQESGSPSVFVPQPLYQFEPVVSGKSVNHDYIIQNKGTAELQITSVKTG